jgi:hypothetical protein
MSFAISSVGEIIILAIMVGILKALKSDASAVNNTKAFSILIAFSGGVWCMSFLNLTDHHVASFLRSIMCHSMVFARKTAARATASSCYKSAYNWFLATLCRAKRMLEAQTNILVPHILFFDVRIL